jgi:hypothetical protein
MRGWIVFNITKIPSDAWVLDATLSLRVWHKTTNDPSQGLGDTTGRVYGAYEILQPWTEYNITWFDQPPYSQDRYATATVPPGQGGWDGPLLYMNWDITGILRDWRSGTPNYGLTVKDTQENSTSILYSTQFFTHDHVPNSGYYPRLLVTYVAPLHAIIIIVLLLVETLFVVAVWRRKLIALK